MVGKSSEEKLEILNNDKSNLFAVIANLQQQVQSLTINSIQLQNEKAELLQQLAFSRESAGSLRNEISKIVDDNMRLRNELTAVEEKLTAVQERLRKLENDHNATLNPLGAREFTSPAGT